jgi:hypothetical protein
LTYDVASQRDWNANIEPEIKDAPKLAEILTNPDNYLEKKWRSRILIENTPRGNVVMFYDIYKRAFSYYCDNAVMPYEIMNAVAMKYVVTFWCRDFFVDSQILPKPTIRDVIGFTEEGSKSERCETGASNENEEKVPEIKTNVPFNPSKQDKKAFVKLKSYNTATKKAGISQEDDKVINCFLHLGASRNWAPITKKVKANPINGFKTDMIPGATNNNKMSYLEYKKLTHTAK